MARGVDLLAFLLCITAPQHEHQMFTLLIEQFDDTRGESLPSAIGVRSSLRLGNREHRIEQQHPLISPTLQ